MSTSGMRTWARCLTFHILSPLSQHPPPFSYKPLQVSGGVKYCIWTKFLSDMLKSRKCLVPHHTLWCPRPYDVLFRFPYSRNASAKERVQWRTHYLSERASHPQMIFNIHRETQHLSWIICWVIPVLLYRGNQNKPGYMAKVPKTQSPCQSLNAFLLISHSSNVTWHSSFYFLDCVLACFPSQIRSLPSQSMLQNYTQSQTYVAYRYCMI